MVGPDSYVTARYIPNEIETDVQEGECRLLSLIFHKLIGSVAWKNIYTSQDNIFSGYIAHYNSK